MANKNIGFNLDSVVSGDLMVGNSANFALLNKGSEGQFLTVSGGVLAWGTVSQDHGALTGLSDDDHTQYALLVGRSGGQTLIGGDTQGLTLYGGTTSGSVTIGGNADGTNSNILLRNDGNGNEWFTFSMGVADAIRFQYYGQALMTLTSGSVTVDKNTNLNDTTTVTVSNAANVPLTVKGAVGQTANLLEIQDSAGSDLVKVTTSARLVLGSSADKPSFTPSGTEGLLVKYGLSGITFQDQINEFILTRSLITSGVDHQFDANIGFYGTTPVAQATGYTTFANLVTDRTLDADSTTLAEVADVLGTLIEDLKATGLISA